MRKWKKWLFFLQKLPDTICSGKEKKHFRAHHLIWPKTFLDQNSENQEQLQK